MPYGRTYGEVCPAVQNDILMELEKQDWEMKIPMGEGDGLNVAQRREICKMLGITKPIMIEMMTKNLFDKNFGEIEESKSDCEGAQ